MKRLHIIEDGLSVFALLTMALLPLLEITLRTFFSIGIPGSSVWVQHLTLWVGFMGAAIAARKGEMLSLSAGISLLGQKPGTSLKFTPRAWVWQCAELWHGEACS